jgi:hypothetical protein
MQQQLDMMRCDRQNMTLTRGGCTRLWLSTRVTRPDPWEGRRHCLTCPVGAANAGRPMAQMDETTEALRLICPRCTRVAMRLINGRLCVSCYNREREALIGKNAKGGRPMICDVLHTERLAVIDGSGSGSVIEAGPVVGIVEAIVAMTRTATGPLAFGRPGVTYD